MFQSCRRAAICGLLVLSLCALASPAFAGNLAGPPAPLGTGEFVGAAMFGPYLPATVVNEDGPGTLSASTTWSPAHNPYIVRGDLTIPAGRTLTILPGTKVYFDLGSSGSGSIGTSANPTPLVDLIVHGKIVAKGTSTAPITFTSIRSLPASAAVLGAPVFDDWGALFTDSRSASELSYCTIEYGAGVWAQHTNRPYISNSRVARVRTYGVRFDSPVGDATTPQIRVIGNSFSACGVEVRHDIFDADSGPRTIAPLIANNVFKEGSIELTIRRAGTPSAFGAYTIGGTISGNRIANTGDYPVTVEISSWDASPARFSTTFSHNDFANDDNGAVNVRLQANDTGSLYVNPTFTGDKLGVWNNCLRVQANAPLVDGTGGTYIEPRFTDCTLASSDDVAIWIVANNGGKGPVSIEPQFHGGTLDAPGNSALLLNALMPSGDVKVSPVLDGVSGACGLGTPYGVLIASTGSGGSATCSPRITNSTIVSEMADAFRLTASTATGTATAAPVVKSSSIRAMSSVFDISAAASQPGGRATVGGSISSSNVRTTGGATAFSERADVTGPGTATVSTTFTSTRISGAMGGLILISSHSSEGAVVASPKLSSVVASTSGPFGVVVQAGRAGGSDHADVKAEPTIANSRLTANLGVGLDLTVENFGHGDAIARPTISGSVIDSRVAFGMRAISRKSSGVQGEAISSPTISGSTIAGSPTAVLIQAFGPGDPGEGAVSKATASGSVIGSEVSAFSGAALQYLADNSGGSAEVRPSISGCTLSAAPNGGYGLLAQASGFGRGDVKIWAAPTVTSTKVLHAGTGFDVSASSASSTSSESVVCEPVFSGCEVVSSFNDAIRTDANSSSNGSVINNTLVKSTPVTSNGPSTAAIWLQANAGGAATVRNTARVIGGSSSKRAKIVAKHGEGVRFTAQGADGKAVNAAEARYLTIVPKLSAIRSTVAVSGVNLAEQRSAIEGIVADPTWQLEGAGVLISADSGGAAALSSTVKASTITRPYRDGIVLEVCGASETQCSPTVSGNTLISAGEGAIVVDATRASSRGSGAAASATSTVTIARNKVTRPDRSGIIVRGVPLGDVWGNSVADASWANAYNAVSPPWLDASGIYWTGATPAAMVRGNLVTGSRYALGFASGAPSAEYNSLGGAAGAPADAPFGYATDAGSIPAPRFDARHNWWGSAASADVSAAVYAPGYAGPATDVVDVSGWLPTLQPRVASISVKKASTKVKFAVTFDRPMDTAITKLYFGKSSPYKTYSLKGTWNAAGTTFTGTYSPRKSLPVGKKLYFSGAKDLPGSAMLPTSRGFKL